MCGESLGSSLRYRFGTGSPPRVRGKLAGVDHRRIFRRITPAYAGKVTDLLRSQSRIAVSCSYYIALEGNRFAQNVNMVECLSRVDERGIS